MNNVQIGCGQITWFVANRQRDEAAQLSEEQVLAEIAQAGYAGAPAMPKEGVTTQERLDLFAKHGLKPAPGYFAGDFWNPGNEQAILERVRSVASFAQQAGCTELYVAAGGFASHTTARGLTRMQIAGHVQPEDYLTDIEFAQFAKVLNRVGEITLESGVKSCFHNHVGSTIETREEIDRLFSLVDSGLVFMGPDTGHLAWGGADVLEFCRDYAESIKTIHVKDVNQSVMQEGIAAEWDYQTFSQKGVWTELGQGYIDFPALFQLLADADFTGWVIVETDVTQLATPLESAIVSRQYLKDLGM
ncbi:sugar phosphate isomerase/epimerase [Chloroflexi bacterium TSY]|nr:sugar phosphate isomerase/epimerase [Chloroflexi bacterium TSY]